MPVYMHLESAHMADVPLVIHSVLSMNLIEIVLQHTSQRARPAAELRIILVVAVPALDDQFAVRKERIVQAVLRNVRALHVDLFGVR